MKKRKILFGIIAAILLFGTYTAIGQNPDQGLNFLGPNNLAGRTRTIVIDQQAEGDAVVLYTAGVSGGLFKSENGGKTWMPVLDNAGNEFVLPISCMVQNEGKLLIGTGEGLSVSNLDNKGLIIPKGKGIYQYDPATAQFTCVIAADQNLEYVNKMVVNGGYLYFATNTGLFRAAMGAAQYETIFDGGKVQDLDLAGERLYFTKGADVYMIDSLSKGVEYLKVKTNHANTASRVELAVAPTDESYVYLTVADANGNLEGVYMTNTGYTVEMDSVVGTIDTIAEVSEVDTIVSEINVVDSNISVIDTLVSELDTLTTTLIIDTIPEISEIVVSDTLITIDSVFSAIDSTTMDSIFTVSYDTTYVFDTTFTYIYDSLYAYTFDTTFAYDTNYAYIYDTIFTYDTTFAYKYDTLGYDYFNIYLTEWNKISTSTVALFTSRNGWYSNTLAVSPTDPKKLYLAGSNLWVAQGLEGTNIYTWTMESNAAYGRPSAFYVHENIHDIAFLNDSVYYLATDGGIFKYGEIWSFDLLCGTFQ
jgi:hypothetical protein